MPFLSHTPYLPPSYAEIGEYLISGTTQSMYATSVSNFEALRGVAVSSIAYTSDDLRVTGLEVLPDDLKPGETMPLMLYNRGGSGNHGMLSPGQVTVMMAPFVKHMRLGVLASNYRGNGGSEGRDEFGGSDVNDVLNLLALGKKQPWWDGKNIFMLGWSRGGMMAYMALRAGAELTAVAIGAGLADMHAMVGRRVDLARLYQHFMPPGQTLEQALDARSAVRWPEALSVPLLLLHGDADDTVEVGAARELVGKLEALGRPVKYVEYAGGDHVLRKHWKEWLGETVAWFEKYKRA